jgi:Ergosterol biosynthesis ERG4/ERG24 family
MWLPNQVLLAGAGWWGLSRHFHYVPEISAAFLWTVPGGFTHLLPYFYVVFLTLLLTVRRRPAPAVFGLKRPVRCSLVRVSACAPYQG